MVLVVSASGSPAQTRCQTVGTSLEHIEATARLAAEASMVVHVVVARAPGVVEHARRAARELGLTCGADLRAHSVRIRFDPLRRLP